MNYEAIMRNEIITTIRKLYIQPNGTKIILMAPYQLLSPNIVVKIISKGPQ
jgi:hypothetical protein